MGWAIRGQRAYLYKSVRVDGRVKCVYVPLDRAEAVARSDQERRDAIRAARREAARDRGIVEAATRAVREAFTQALAQAGYHHRGQLRKKRTMQTPIEQSQELIPSPMDTEPTAALVRRAVLRIVEGVDPQTRDELIGEFQRVRDEFSATVTTPAERLLAEEVSLTWLELYKLRITHISLPPAQTVFWTRMLDSSQLRLLRATELLSRIQRLAMPVDSGQ